MKLSEKSVEMLTGNTGCINLLAYNLRKHSRSIERLIKDNKEDSILTTVTAVTVIQKETGLSKSEILTK